MRTRIVIAALLATFVAGTGTALRAQDAAASDAPSAAASFNLFSRPPEIVEMVAAIAGGSQMGPGEGWFHRGQTRFDWNWIADRSDLDGDGVVYPQEFQGERALFGILDRTQDGALAADDLPGGSSAGDAQQMQMVARWFGPMDGNSNGRLSKEEWAAVFDKLSGGKDFMSPRDVRRFLLGPPPSIRPAAPVAQAPPSEESRSGPSVSTLIKGLAQGELGSWWEGPRINQEAPDFDLPLQKGKGRIRLSKFKGDKPVVLIFGSFT